MYEPSRYPRSLFAKATTKTAPRPIKPPAAVRDPCTGLSRAMLLYPVSTLPTNRPQCQHRLPRRPVLSLSQPTTGKKAMTKTKTRRISRSFSSDPWRRKNAGRLQESEQGRQVISKRASEDCPSVVVEKMWRSCGLLTAVSHERSLEKRFGLLLLMNTSSLGYTIHTISSFPLHRIEVLHCTKIARGHQCVRQVSCERNVALRSSKYTELYICPTLVRCSYSVGV